MSIGHPGQDGRPGTTKHPKIEEAEMKVIKTAQRMVRSSTTTIIQYKYSRNLHGWSTSSHRHENTLELHAPCLRQAAQRLSETTLSKTRRIVIVFVRDYWLLLGVTGYRSAD